MGTTMASLEGSGRAGDQSREGEGAFSRYAKEEELEVAGFTSCGGCPRGDIEYTPEEMLKNGAEAIHLATGLVVGFPPCPSVDYFRECIEGRSGVPVVVGAHPIPEHHVQAHDALCSQGSGLFSEEFLATPEIRVAYE